MARRGFFGALVADMERAERRKRQEAARAQRDAVRAEREAQRAHRESLRQLAAYDREAKRQYAEDRLAEATAQNEELIARVEALSAVLTEALERNAVLDFESMKATVEYPPFVPPSPAPGPAPDKAAYEVHGPTGLSRFVPGAKSKHERAAAEAEQRFAESLAAHAERVRSYNASLAKASAEYDAAKSSFLHKVRERNGEIDDFAAKFHQGEPEAIIAYNTLVLDESAYPEGFPQDFRIAYIPESKELVCEYELPPPTIVPEVGEYRYVKARDVIEVKPRKNSAIKDLYQDVVASTALRTLHELFTADVAKHIQVVVFNGFVKTVDPATGKDVRPCLISIRVTRTQFEELDLSRVSKAVCLRNLGAQVSPRPNEAQPVKPIVEFDMVDKRFVQESDVLSDLESRPNLMDLNPFEFENLVANLFGKMGLESKLTRSSRDGGVDAVAFDRRPVLGGKVVIQAKRYKNTVGVSAVRDLYGTMLNEGASKGILVTTSGYGPDAFEFAKDKPIELLDGGQLLYLLHQVGVRARIVFPEDGSGASA